MEFNPSGKFLSSIADLFVTAHMVRVDVEDNIWTADINQTAELAGSPRLLARDAGAWQAVAFGKGIALAVTHVGKGSGAHGPIDIVFANAGLAEMAPLEAVSEEHFDKLFNVNVKGVLFTVQKALPLLNAGGSIILTGSVASAKGTPAFAVYGASKAAIRNFVRGWTVELKDRRIRSNVLSPGPVTTSMVAGQPQDAIEKIASTIPMGRMGEPGEVAKAALFLASDDSSFVTGIELFVDGGRAQI